MSGEKIIYDDEGYVDVNSLPLRPPQPLLPPEKPVRRPWHPVMWDNSIMGIPTPPPQEEDKPTQISKEYPHKQRIRNLRRLIEQGKVPAAMNDMKSIYHNINRHTQIIYQYTEKLN